MAQVVKAGIASSNYSGGVFLLVLKNFLLQLLIRLKQIMSVQVKVQLLTSQVHWIRFSYVP